MIGTVLGERMEEVGMMGSDIWAQTFHELEESTIERLRRHAQRRTYPPGTILCRQGEIGHTFYVVVEGKIAIIQNLDDGNKRFLGLRLPAEYFGELSLLDNTPRMANCIAVTETTVLEVTQDVFATILKESPGVAYEVLQQIIRFMRENDRIALYDLADANRELLRAYDELKAAQAEILEKQRLEHELELAAIVQRSLLPAQLPQYNDYNFAAYLRPARYIGGDFYDVIELDDEHVGLLLADVVDKSVHAALFMAVTRTLFRTESRRSLSPCEVATSVHRGMLDISEGAQMFVTAFYGVLHRPTGKLTYIVAGHERPLLVRLGKKAQTVHGEGRFLGMINPLQLQEFYAWLKRGDRLLVFSDGVTEAMNAFEQLYGYKRLRNVLSSNGSVAVDDLLRIIAADVNAWSGLTPPTDDLTMLVIEAAMAATA